MSAHAPLDRALARSPRGTDGACAAHAGARPLPLGSARADEVRPERDLPRCVRTARHPLGVRGVVDHAGRALRVLRLARAQALHAAPRRARAGIDGARAARPACDRRVRERVARVPHVRRHRVALRCARDPGVGGGDGRDGRAHRAQAPAGRRHRKRHRVGDRGLRGGAPQRGVRRGEPLAGGARGVAARAGVRARARVARSPRARSRAGARRVGARRIAPPHAALRDARAAPPHHDGALAARADRRGGGWTST